MRALRGEVVEFECAIGAARAAWRGAELPRVGDDADVELDLESAVALEACDEAPSLKLDGEDTVLTALVEVTEAGGGLVLRLARDGLMLHHPDAPPPAGARAVRARCPATALTAWPFQL